MCGIAALLYKTGEGPIGSDVMRMTAALEHRGPDSTGYALYGGPEAKRGEFVAWVKVVQGEELGAIEMRDYQKGEIVRVATALGAEVYDLASRLDYALRMDFDFDGELKRLIDAIEAIGPEVEITGVGRAMELTKDVGVADHVAGLYGLQEFTGTHGMGHARMATESNVDVSHAHPFWAYPYPDICVVHNGQITNYHRTRRLLEGRGHRFRSHNDSELIAVYLAARLSTGSTLRESLEHALEDLDGVFTFVAMTESEMGVAKDELAAKPLVVYEDERAVAVASEEVALRQVWVEEIDTWDPYESEVMTWHKQSLVPA
jgi:glutamate synthase domain-containing protein 1